MEKDSYSAQIQEGIYAVVTISFFNFICVLGYIKTERNSVLFVIGTCCLMIIMISIRTLVLFKENIKRCKKGKQED